MKISENIDIKKIKLLVLDVDGTLTDGKLYIGNNGELFKKFDVRDGSGIHDILPTLGIKPVIITARKSAIVEHRCKELGIELVFQAVRNKREKLYQICQKEGFKVNSKGEFEEIAYMGDDIIDLPVMQIAALKACPADASQKVLVYANHIAEKNGGAGAVRELIEYLQENRL